MFVFNLFFLSAQQTDFCAPEGGAQTFVYRGRYTAINGYR